MSKHGPRRILGPAPAKPVLAGLTALVLAGHWFALGGQLPSWWGGKSTSPAEQAPLPGADAPATTTGLPPPPAAQTMPLRVATSTVRWIVPAPPPPPPAPPPPPPPPPPKKVVKKPPPPPPEPPEPDDSVAVEAQMAVAPSYEMPAESMADLEVLVPIETGSETTAEPADPQGRPADSEITPAPPAVGATDGGAAPAAAPLPPAQLPPSARLRYDVAGQIKGFNYSASGRLDWFQDGSTYEATLEVSAFLLGSIVQTSTGRLSTTGLAPDRFIDKRRKEKSAEFDHQSQRIRYSSNAKVDTLLAGAQDQVSISLQLGGLLNANPQYTEGQTLSLPVSGASSSETWRFDIGPETTLDLPAGPMLTRLLTRQARRKGDKTVQIWLAPTLENLPVRIRISESNGDFIDQLLEEMPSLSAGTPTS